MRHILFVQGALSLEEPCGRPLKSDQVSEVYNNNNNNNNNNHNHIKEEEEG